jgi:hypothetical protein
MDNFIEFVTNNYIWFLVISIFLIFALIGYIVDSKRDGSSFKRRSRNVNINTVEIDIPEDLSINEVINNTNMAIDIDTKEEPDKN